MNTIVWSETWHMFDLHVLKDANGQHRAIMVAPWDMEGRLSRAAYDDVEQAKSACFGLARQACDIMAGLAVREMHKQNAPLERLREKETG